MIQRFITAVFFFMLIGCTPQKSGEWTWWHPDATGGFNSRIVYDAEIDSEGNVWFAGLNGITQFDGKEWVRYDSSNSPLPGIENAKAIRSIAFDNTGALWVAVDYSDESLFRLKNGKWINMHVPENIGTTRYLESIEFDTKGVMWTVPYRTQGAKNSLAALRKYGWNVYDTTSLFIPQEYSHLFKDNSGNIWLVGNKRRDKETPYTYHFFAKYDGRKWKIITDLVLPSVSVSIRDIAVQSSGAIWFCTGGEGVYRFDGDKWEQFDSTNSPVSGDWYGLNLFVDSKDQMWISTPDKLLRTVDGEKWEQIQYPDKQILRMVPLVEDSLGKIWFHTTRLEKEAGLNKWGLYQYHDGIWDAHPVCNTRMVSPYISRVIDKGSTKFFVYRKRDYKRRYSSELNDTEIGISRFDTSGWSYSALDSIPLGEEFNFEVAREPVNYQEFSMSDSLWEEIKPDDSLFWGDSLPNYNYFRGSYYEHIRFTQGPDSVLYGLFPNDYQKRKWRIARYDGSRWERIDNIAPSIFQRQWKTNKLYVDKNNVLWIITKHGGVYQFTPDDK